MKTQNYPILRPNRRVVLGGAAAILATPFIQARAQSSITLKFGSVEPRGDNPPFNADDWFCKECTQRSGGDLTITHFPAGELGAQRDLVEGLKLGTVDIVGTSAALLSSYVKQIAIFDLPYIFTDKAKLYAFLDGPDGEDLMINGMGAAGFRGLAYYDYGVRDVFNSKKRIRSIEDLKGLKIRVEENPIRIGAFNAMGAQATPMAFTEVYTAIQQGVVDGYEAPPSSHIFFKFHEVAKFGAKTEHFITPAVRLMSLSAWEKLPADTQTLVTQVAAETTKLEREQWLALEQKTFDDLAKLGTILDDVDKEGFRKAVEPFVAEQTAAMDKTWVDKVLQAAT